MAAGGCSEANTASKLPCRLERDLAEEVFLRHYYGLHPHHFEHRQEHRNHGAPRALPFKDAHNENRPIGPASMNWSLKYRIISATVTSAVSTS